MAAPTIDRTAYTALVDDSGLGADGTIWQKSNIKDILDATDGLAVNLDVVGGQLDVTVTGAVNDYAPGTGPIIRWNGAAQVTFNGVVPRGGSVGDIRIFQNITSSQAMFFATQAAGSTAANRFVLPSIVGQWIGPGGCIGFTYDNANSRWRVLFVRPGAPISPTFSSGDYTHNTGGGTWTVTSGEITMASFQQVDTVVRMWLRIDGSAVGGTAGSFLKRALPGGFTVAAGARGIIEAIDNGAGIAAFWQAGLGVGTAFIIFGRLDGANWSNASSNTGIHAPSMDIPIQ